MHCRFTSPSCRMLIIILVGAFVCAPAARSEEPDEAIRRALDKKIAVDFSEAPLSQVIAKLSSDQGVSAVLDKKALDDAGLGADTPITFKVGGASLRNVLKLMLKDLDLTWIIEDDVLVVTTVDEAGQRLTTKVHDVSDLLKSQMAGLDTAAIPPDSFDMEPLVDMISAMVAPTTWDQVGGPGSIKSFNGMLVISQTEAAHEEIDKLLAELRKVQAKREEGHRRAEAQPTTTERTGPQDLQLRIYRIGRRSANTGSILISTIPVVGSIEQPAQDSTTKPGDRVAPLAQFGGGSTVPPRTPAPTANTKSEPEVMKELEAIIPVFIEPKSWQSSGGQGVIRTLSVGGDGSFGTLLVRQTPAVHAQITQLLMRLNAGMRLSTALGGGNFF